MQKNVLEYLEASARRCPEKTAFTDGARSFTYAQLLSCAKGLGTHLARTAPCLRRPGRCHRRVSRAVPIGQVLHTRLAQQSGRRAKNGRMGGHSLFRRGLSQQIGFQQDAFLRMKKVLYPAQQVHAFLYGPIDLFFLIALTGYQRHVCHADIPLTIATFGLHCNRGRAL